MATALPAYEPTIYDRANLAMMQNALGPLVGYAQDSADKAQAEYLLNQQQAFRMDQQDRAFRQADQAAQAERLFRKAENEAGFKSRERIAETGLRRAAEADDERFAREIFKTTGLTKRANESMESFLERSSKFVEKEKDNLKALAKDNLLSSRESAEAWESEYNSAIQSATQERRTRIDAKARARATANLGITPEQFSKGMAARKADYVTEYEAERQRAEESEEIDPALAARAQMLRAGHSNALELYKRAVDKANDTGVSYRDLQRPMSTRGGSAASRLPLPANRPANPSGINQSVPVVPIAPIVPPQSAVPAPGPSYGEVLRSGGLGPMDALRAVAGGADLLTRPITSLNPLTRPPTPPGTMYTPDERTINVPPYLRRFVPSLNPPLAPPNPLVPVGR